ncbi:CDP-glycerol glycerophosphotransferase family protein [[Brevibacterium] frigoritolerans]|uniref:CDP-glycerol glycerophosphotransferase family protein n=1 Tax=Peribacillus frigoritolerans TaxID=450367 RepID=A0A941J288_9BACI|nr:CDP-glycerol glycerophosphotransferase family protein [Peribacillus frigoritolerans]
MLYAPTFRNDGLNNGEIALDLELLYKELKGENYALLLKLHPAVKAEHDLQDKFQDSFTLSIVTFTLINC